MSLVKVFLIGGVLEPVVSIDELTSAFRCRASADAGRVESRTLRQLFHGSLLESMLRSMRGAYWC